VPQLFVTGKEGKGGSEGEMWGWGLVGSGSVMRRPVTLCASALVVVAISVGCVELMQRDERVGPGMMRKTQTFGVHECRWIVWIAAVATCQTLRALGMVACLDPYEHLLKVYCFWQVSYSVSRMSYGE
jgi:hypothetical protein